MPITSPPNDANSIEIERVMGAIRAGNTGLPDIVRATELFYDRIPTRFTYAGADAVNGNDGGALHLQVGQTRAGSVQFIPQYIEVVFTAGSGITISPLISIGTATGSYIDILPATTIVYSGIGGRVVLPAQAVPDIPVSTLLYCKMTSATATTFTFDVTIWGTYTGLPGVGGSIGGSVQAFPIGSVFIGVVSTDPATLLGYGTWSAFGAGRVLVGLNGADTDFDVVEETGGAKTVASAGTVSAPTFTGSSMSTHTHSNHTLATVGLSAGADTLAVTTNTHSSTSAGTPAGTNSVPTFTGSATSVVQPYIVCYFWKRTA